MRYRARATRTRICAIFSKLSPTGSEGSRDAAPTGDVAPDGYAHLVAVLLANEGLSGLLELFIENEIDDGALARRLRRGTSSRWACRPARRGAILSK